MIEKLTKELKDKIASFDICKPYVWLLKLSEADFNELEVCLNDIASANGFSALVSPQFAIETIIYIAEWYKRKYQSGNSNPLVEKLNLEALWINASINQKLFLYNDDKKVTSVGYIPFTCSVVLLLNMNLAEMTT